MTKNVQTADEARQAIIDGDQDELKISAIEWSNCTEVDISANGNVWVRGPQTGHWLNDGDLVTFINWCLSH